MPLVSSFLKYEWPKVPVSDCSDWPHLKSLTNHRTLYSGQIHLSGSSPRYTYFYLRSNSVARNSAQFRENLIASLFAIIAQFLAIKWCKRKQALRATEFRLEILVPLITIFSIYINNFLSIFQSQILRMALKKLMQV